MIAYWVMGKKGAFVRCEQPTALDDGRFCRVTDLENGEIPVPTYGRTPDEVYSKIERTGMHARQRLGTVPAPQRQAPRAAPPAGRRLSLTADEQLAATRELEDPQKAPGAITRLFESETGIDTQKLASEAFAGRVAAWGANHPEIRDNNFNQRLICDNAILRAKGNIRLVDAAVLEAAFQDLKAGGYVLTDEDLPPAQNQPSALPPVQPGQSPAPRTPKTEPAFATSHRLNRTGSSQPPQWQPKYTREQIDRMPLAQSEKLLKSSDKDYVEAVDYHYPPRQARA